MLAGNQPPRVPDWRSRVLIGGRDFTSAVTGWEIEYKLGAPSDRMPVPVGRGDASGQITVMSTTGPVAPKITLNPTRGTTLWPPPPGTTTQIDVSCDDWYTSFPVSGRGMVVDSADSDVAGTVELTGPWDMLDARIDESALLARMVPAPGGAQNSPIRFMGVHHAWWINRAFIAAGIGPGYRYDMRAALIAPLNGSAWPIRGMLATSQVWGPTLLGFTTARPGVTGSATWQLGAAVDPAVATGGTLMADWQVTFIVDGSHQAQATLDVIGAGDTTRILVGAAGDVMVTVAGAQKHFAPRPAPALNVELDIVTVTKRGTSLSVSRAGGTGTTPVPASLTAETLALDAQAGNGVYALEVRAATSSTPLSRERDYLRVHVEESGLLGMLGATPRVSGSVADLLETLSRVTLSAWTLDEMGAIRWIPWARVSTNARLTLTSAEDMLSKLAPNWNLRALAGRVTIKRETTSDTAQTLYGARVWQGSGEQIDAALETQVFADVPDDEDWVGVDTTIVHADTSTIAMTLGKGSYMGAVREQGKDADGDPLEVGANSSITGRVERLGYGTYKIVTKNTSNTTIHQRTLATKAQAPGWRGVPLPILQAFAKLKWVDASVSRTTSAPVTAGELVVDVGRFCSDAHAEILLDELQPKAALSWPVVSGMEIQPDPRIQLGDTHFAKAPESDNDLVVRIIGKKLSHDPERGLRMWVDFMVIDWATPGTTYQELKDVADLQAAAKGGASGTYGDLKVPSQSYASWQSDPTGALTD